MSSPLTLTLHLASFSEGAALPEEALAVLESRLAQTFDEACGEHLALTIETLDPGAGYPSNLSLVAARELHDFARALNGNPVHWGIHRLTGPPVPSISCIFAEYYSPAAEVLGVMFDRGFDTGDDHNNSRLYTGVPREGCAVFVGACRDLRRNEQNDPDGSDIIEEVWFTTTHELGHVFNLQHTVEVDTYLSQSPDGAPYRWRQVDFSDRQKGLLQQCDTSPQVWPGGSDFGDDALYGNHDRPRSSSHRIMTDLDLRLGLSKHEFYRFEPIELDVSLKLARGASRRMTVPNCIDPGYEQFRIWIEEPNGERRLYRSPRRYCPSRARLHIEPGRAFRRDISIFGESGGYTFRGPGVYGISAEFDLGRRGVVRSNQLLVNVLPYRPGKPGFERSFALFGGRAAAHVLYHRAARSNRRVLAKLTELANEHARLPGVEALRYAVGRALLSDAARGQGESRQRSRDAGVAELRKALRRTALGAHRIERTEHILSQLEEGTEDLHEALWRRPRT